MTSDEIKEFYKNDDKKYEIGKNKHILSWLKKKIKEGYNCYVYPDDLQELIDSIVDWYETKYPDKEVKKQRANTVTDVNQFISQLPTKQQDLMKCGYRSKIYGTRIVRNEGKIKELVPHVFIHIKQFDDKLPDLYIRADHQTGEILQYYQLEDYIGTRNNLKLDDLLAILNEKYSHKLDYTELIRCVYHHDVDLELRNKILQLAALKMLYSRNTTPEYGYARATKFVEEFNEELGKNLSTKELDEVVINEITYNKSSKKGKRKVFSRFSKLK